MYQLYLTPLILFGLLKPVLSAPGTSGAVLLGPGQAVLETFPLRREQNVHNSCGRTSDGKVNSCDPRAPGGGPCCSEFGWCGNGPVYCDKGCQPEFGQCKSKSGSQRQKFCGPKHKNKKCNDDECCSSNGVCGKSEAFCGKHCQPDFGACKEKHDDSKEEPQEQRCGKDLPMCPWPQCCSQAGYCGIGQEFCSVPENCQREYGHCDSDDTPNGMNHTKDPRDHFGKIPYGKLINKCTRPGVAALSFDDGPSVYTEAVLDILRDHGAKATFFLSGINNGKGPIDRSPEWVAAVKRIIMEGHQIGSHGWSHRHMDKLSSAERKNEMFQNEVAITNIVGRYPTYMRAPYLSCDEKSGCLKDMNDLAYHVVTFDTDSEDWKEDTKLDKMMTNIQQALAANSANGSIFSIQHDINDKAPAVTQFALIQIAAKGWKAVTVGECLDDPSEQWYRAPIWNAPVNTADGGCVVTDLNFCGSIKPFHDKQTCKDSVDDCFQNLGFCWSVNGEKHPSCIEYDHICTVHKDHCQTCDGAECDIKNWTFKRW